MSAPHYTETGRHVFRLANDEAAKCNSDFIDTEHVLLSLLSFDDCSAVQILRKLDFDVDVIRHQTTHDANIGDIASTVLRRPMTMAAKKLVEFAIQEAGGLEWGTAHILLACQRSDGVAGDVLRNAGVTAEEVRTAMEAPEIKELE